MKIIKKNLALILIIAMIFNIFTFPVSANGDTVNSEQHDSTRFTITETGNVITVFDGNTGISRDLDVFDSRILIIEAKVSIIDNILRKYKPLYLGEKNNIFFMTFKTAQETTDVYYSIVNDNKADTIIPY